MATMTVKDLATELNTDPRTTRKFLRSTTPTEEHPGKGGRWVIEGNKRQIESLKKRFTAWDEARRADQEVDEDAEVDAD